MTTVEQLIGNLLLRHNCVIIPSFGGFVAKPVSARIDYEKGTMLPPGKSILFNRQLINNDGLLIHEYAQSNKISYDEASTAMSSCVKTWNATLHNGGRIEIENVGNLFFDEERNICFEQDRFCNLLLESFGLGSVHFVTEEDVQIVEHRLTEVPVLETKQEKPKEVRTSVPVEKQTVQPVETSIEVEAAPIIPLHPAVEKEVVAETQGAEVAPKRRNRAWRYVAAACILPIAFYSIWIPTQTDVMESGLISIEDFNPFHKRSQGSYESHELSEKWVSESTIRTSIDEQIKSVKGQANVYSYKFTEDTYLQVAIPAPEVVETPTNVVPETQEVQSFEPNAMHYIVGCFGSKENADNLVAKLRANGLNGQIVDFHNGLHRVTAGAAMSEEAYQNIKLKADSLGLSGWRLK